MIKLQAEQNAFDQERYVQDNFDEETLEDITAAMQFTKPNADTSIEYLFEELKLDSTAK